MKKLWHRKWAVLALALAVLWGGSALAAGGEQDPLVTLSYLSQTVVPQILRDVETQTAKRQEELAEELAGQINFIPERRFEPQGQ